MVSLQIQLCLRQRWPIYVSYLYGYSHNRKNPIVGLQAVLETCGIKSNGLYDVKQEVKAMEEAGATIHVKQEVEAVEEAGATIDITGGQGHERPEGQYRCNRRSRP